MTLIAGLSLLLVFAHLLGRASERLGQPALLGQMLAGLVLGPTLLGWVKANSSLAAIADLSVLFVVITAGLEMRMQHVLDAFRGKGSVALILGFMIPAASAGVFAYAVNMALLPGIVVTLCLSVTALPVALRILDSFGLLNTALARIAISSALLSDVIVLMVLGVAMAMVPTTQATNTYVLTIGLAVAKLGILIAVVGVCHHICLRLSASGLWHQSKTSQAPQPSIDTVLVLTLVFMLTLGAVSELLGFHFVIGVFLAALMVTRDLINDARFESLQHTCELMTVSLFGPLFLAYQGVQFELQALNDYALVGGLLAIAVVSKLIGGYATARLSQLAHREAMGVGVIMNARGVVGMVVPSIAYRAGLIDQALFSTLLLIAIVTTVITPIMLKFWLGKSAVTAKVRD